MANSLAIVGAGRVGRALGKLLHEQGWRIGAVVTQSIGSAKRAVRFIGAGRPVPGISREVLAAQVVLLATPDDQLSPVAQSIVALLGREPQDELRGMIFLHTSGALDAEVLRTLRHRGAAIASMHPLQTFTGIAVPPLEGKLFAVEGDELAVRSARKLVRSLGAKPVKLGAGKKVLYHAAAALAAGHLLAVEEAATRMLMSAGMTRRQATGALLGLTRQVLENFERLGPRAAWTGPLARGDYRVIAAHHAAMRDLPAEYAAAYQALNRLAARVLAPDAKNTLAKLDNFARATKLKKRSQTQEAFDRD
jgi:predicted short-subunit dehydrogenase-like oxidoreductase (DUF2520 family)